MANYYNDNEDLQYYLDKGIDWEPVVALTEREFKAEDGFKSLDEALEFYREVLQLTGEFAAEEMVSVAREGEKEDIPLVDGEVVFPAAVNAMFEKINELGLHGMTVPRELDGMNCPLLTYFMAIELLARADASYVMHFGFHGGMAMAMLIFSLLEGSAEVDRENGKVISTRFDDAIGEILRGEAWGCMDITEPDAGSDMAALRTVGEQDEKGDWFVTGQKIFITSGHGKYHFVIARSEAVKEGDDPMAGLAGLSMFLVQTFEDDENGTRKRFATVDRVEEKMGHHGSATVSVSFDRSPAHLIGQRGEGFKYMLHLMNNARVGVGFESLGVCEAAYRMARDYAAERPSMGKTIDQHEMIADYLDEMRTDIQAIRALAMHCGYHEEYARKEEMRLLFTPPTDAMELKRLERRVKELKWTSRKATPLLKYIASEKAVEISRRCLQIHGGNGYSKEYGAEKLVRDALVMPIYEGTSQIQALMAMKDTLGGIMKNPQAFVKGMAQARWRSFSARDHAERRVAKIQQLSYSAQQHLLTKTASNKFKSLQGKPITQWPQEFLSSWDPKRDFAFAMLHAERLLRLLTEAAICEVLLTQAKKDPERKELLLRYLDRAECRARFLHDEITTTGQRILEQLGRTKESDSVQAAG
jgi:3-(methylthio)propanoyl-CoA dehydrogenase